MVGLGAEVTTPRLSRFGNRFTQFQLRLSTLVSVNMYLVIYQILDLYHFRSKLLSVANTLSKPD